MQTAAPLRGQPDEKTGSRAAIACGHPAGAMSALRVLEAGGNVVDAAIAASAVLTVVMPQATTIGGDAFVLVRDASGDRVHGLNASGYSPQCASPEMFKDGMKQRGALAPVVPGLVRGWEALHQKFATRPWGALLSDAINCATEGFVVNESLAASVLTSVDQLQVDGGCRELFLPESRPIQVGQLLKQPALAATLRAIAARGADELYRGGVGAAIVRRIQRRGGCLDFDDLRAFGTAWADPLTSDHYGHKLHVMPPNSLGVLMLMQLRALATLPKKSLNGDTFDRILWQIRAMRAVFGTALHEIGDPSAMRLKGADLLGDLTSATVASRMRAELPGAIPARAGGTACVCVADSKGNAACIVQSIFNPFGAYFLDPETGILFNNRMFGFDHLADHANSIGPRKRSAHTLNPVIATKDGQLALVYASPGGISQTITGTQVFVNLLDRGMALAPAIHDARWAVDRAGDILVEPRVPSPVMSQLADAGLRARQMADPYFYGSPTAIDVLPSGRLTAVADARREGGASAF